MKSNLFKKIGAMVTTVAMIASLGTVAFAAASITIDDAATSISDPDANNVRTVTVTYNATEVTGEVAVLGYVGTEAANDVETYAAYDETKHTIVGIEQEAVDTTNKTITFKVKQDSSEDQSNVTGKDYLYITLGAQGVDVADTAVIELATEPPVETNWTATQVAFVGDADLSVDVDYGADKAAAALATLKAAAITLGNGTKSVNTTLEALGAVVNYGTPAVSGDVYTYTITFTAGDSGINDTDGKDVLLGTDLTLTKAVTVNEDDAPVVNPDNFVTIGAAEAEYDETNNIFDVTVPYTTTNAKENAEVAMMAYIGRTSAFTDDTETEYTNETDMRIIGIAQKTNGTNGGTFEYKVTGDIGENTYMVVKVGAQGVNVAPDMVAIPLTKTTTPVVTDITAAYGTVADLEDLANDNIATVSAALSGKTVSIKNDSNAEVATYVLGTATAEKLATATTVNGATYNYATTIAAATDVTETGENTNVIIPADFKVYFNITVAPVVWTVTSGTMGAISVTVAADADDVAIDTAIKAAIVGKKITLTSGTTGQTAETTVADTWAVAKVDADTYKVTVPADATLANVLPEGADVTMAQIDVEFGVTVTREASENFTITGFKAYDSTGAEVSKIEVANGTTEADAKAAIAAKVASIKALGDGEVAETGWTASEWTIASYNAETAGDYTATATLVAPADAKGENTNSVALTITVTVKAAVSLEQYMRGDADLGDSIGNNDWQVILNHLTGRRPNNNLKEENNVSSKTKVWMSADADFNGSIGNNDWQVILNHLTGRRPNANIGQKFNMSDYNK